MFSWRYNKMMSLFCSIENCSLKSGSQWNKCVHSCIVQVSTHSPEGCWWLQSYERHKHRQSSPARWPVPGSSATSWFLLKCWTSSGNECSLLLSPQFISLVHQRCGTCESSTDGEGPMNPPTHWQTERQTPNTTNPPWLGARLLSAQPGITRHAAHFHLHQQGLFSALVQILLWQRNIHIKASYHLLPLGTQHVL